MATQRLVVDLDQYLKDEDVDVVNQEIYNYVWGYIQNKYGANDIGQVSVNQHRHHAESSACTACVDLATDGRG